MGDSVETEELVNELVKSSDPVKIKSLYRQWSSSYDDDLAAFGYVAPTIAVEQFLQTTVNKQSTVLDAGCGTGLVGSLLSSHGFSQLDGCDFSVEMIDKAAQHKCYRKLTQMDLSKSVPIDTGTYDCVISVGVFNRMMQKSFIFEMLRVVKSGGHVTLSCREQYLPTVLDNIRDLYQLAQLKGCSIKVDDYMTGQNAMAYYVTLEKA